MLVMAGHSASKTRVNALMFPAIHVFLFASKSWMPATISAYTRVFDALCAGMTTESLELIE